MDDRSKKGIFDSGLLTESRITKLDESEVCYRLVSLDHELAADPCRFLSELISRYQDIIYAKNSNISQGSIPYTIDFKSLSEDDLINRLGIIEDVMIDAKYKMNNNSEVSIPKNVKYDIEDLFKEPGMRDYKLIEISEYPQESGKFLVKSAFLRSSPLSKGNMAVHLYDPNGYTSLNYGHFDLSEEAADKLMKEGFTIRSNPDKQYDTSQDNEAVYFNRSR